MEDNNLDPRKEFFEFMELLPEAMAIGEVIYYNGFEIDLSTIRPDCFMPVLIKTIYDIGVKAGEAFVKNDIKNLLGIKEV